MSTTWGGWCVLRRVEKQGERLLNCYLVIVPRDSEDGLSLRMLSCQLLLFSTFTAKIWICTFRLTVSCKLRSDRMCLQLPTSGSAFPHRARSCSRLVGLAECGQ